MSPTGQRSILDCIGNTPFVFLKSVVRPSSADVVLKLEFFNPTGSYKDRAALAMILGAEKRGELRAGMRVVEFTAGNTGAALAMICAVKGYPFTPVTSDAYSAEKLKVMEAFGAKPFVIPSGPDGISAELVRRLQAATEKEARDPEVFYTDQFSNVDALDGGAAVGRELLEQLDGHVDVFCAAVGSAALLLGVAEAFRRADCRARIVALEPASAPILTAGHGGAHRVDGVAVSFVPPHMRDKRYEAMAVDESRAREMARRLAREEGIMAGTSTGLNVLAALDLAEKLGPGHTVATVAVDTGLKYVNSGLF